MVRFSAAAQATVRSEERKVDVQEERGGFEAIDGQESRAEHECYTIEDPVFGQGFMALSTLVNCQMFFKFRSRFSRLC